MQAETKDYPRFSVWRMLALCAAAVCVVLLWIALAFPGRVLDLWFYFGYMTTACTFIPLPTPQLAMDYGQTFNPVLTAVLGGIGSCISGLIDYALVAVIFRYDKIARIKTTRTYRYVEQLFRKAPFTTLVIAAFTPIPFEPVKLLACATQYNRMRFVLAIFIGRSPRYLLLGLLQRQLLIPREYLYGSILLLVALAVARKLLSRPKPAN